MSRKSRLYTIVHIIITALYWLAFALLSRNYNSHIMNNMLLFIITGCYLILIHIPSTIILSIHHQKKHKKLGMIALTIVYAVFSMFMYFCELSMYLNYIDIYGI